MGLSNKAPRAIWGSVTEPYKIDEDMVITPPAADYRYASVEADDMGGGLADGLYIVSNAPTGGQDFDGHANEIVRKFTFPLVPDHEVASTANQPTGGEIVGTKIRVGAVPAGAFAGFQTGDIVVTDGADNWTVTLAMANVVDLESFSDTSVAFTPSTVTDLGAAISYVAVGGTWVVDNTYYFEVPVYNDVAANDTTADVLKWTAGAPDAWVAQGQTNVAVILVSLPTIVFQSHTELLIELALQSTGLDPTASAQTVVTQLGPDGAALISTLPGMEDGNFRYYEARTQIRTVGVAGSAQSNCRLYNTAGGAVPPIDSESTQGNVDTTVPVALQAIATFATPHPDNEITVTRALVTVR
jgi:hypothetical protein